MPISTGPQYNNRLCVNHRLCWLLRHPRSTNVAPQSRLLRGTCSTYRHGSIYGQYIITTCSQETAPIVKCF